MHTMLRSNTLLPHKVNSILAHYQIRKQISWVLVYFVLRGMNVKIKYCSFKLFL